jgi:transposase
VTEPHNQLSADSAALPARPRKPPCPNCGTKLQIKCLADDWGEIFGKWRYCEDCGWDERNSGARS